MKLTGFYPLLLTTDVARAAAFYTTHLGFETVFAMDWYVQLRSSGERTYEMAIISHDHDTIPVAGRVPTQGLVLSFYVEDVDTIYDALRGAGLPVLTELRDEAFGQRHFVTADPDGVMIDIIKEIPPSPEFLAAYS